MTLLAGDVYFCGGQSNMEWKLNQIDATADRDAVTTDAVRYAAGSHVFCRDPAQDIDATWQIARGDTAGDCSAIGFHMAHRLYQQTGRPVGLIVNAVGGSMIEAWMPKDVSWRAQKVCAELKKF